MPQRDYQPIVKSGLIVIGTTAWMIDLVSNLTVVPAERYIIVVIGNTLLSIVLCAYVIAIDISRYSTGQALQLLPQTQLALWLVGMAAVLLATDGLRWFHPTVSAWVFVAVALTLVSWGGFIWLWQQLATGRKGG